MFSLRRRNTITTITATAVIICGCNTVLFIKPVQVLADRDAYLQEKYLLNQLKNKRKGGFLFRKKKKNDSDPAVQYQRQQNRLNTPASSFIAIFLVFLAALCIFRVSFAETAIIWISGVCSQISDFTGAFAQQHTSETSRRKRDRNNNSSNRPARRKTSTNKKQMSRGNSFEDQSISPSVMEIIDMETIIDEPSSSAGVISSLFDTIARARKNFVSSSKRKDTPSKRHNDHSSSSHNRKSHKDKSSLRLRASGKQKSSRRDEELGDDDNSNISLPGFLNFIEEDEYYSDNGTAFAVESPHTPSPKRDKHSQKKTNAHGKKKIRESPLQKKLSVGSADEKKHQSHHHSSRRHTKHHH